MMPGYKQTEVGVIPEDWEAIPVGDQVKLQGGYAFQSINFCDIGIPVIRISNVQNGIVDLSDAVSHPQFAISRNFIVQKGDPVIAMSGATTGKVGVYGFSKPAYQNQRVGRFVPRDIKQTSLAFIRQFVGSGAFRNQLSVFLEQGAQPNISSSQIESLWIPLPPTLAEQEAIAGALSDADALIDSLEQLIAKKRLLKQGAMQDLLTGKKRLPGFEGEWETVTLAELGEVSGSGVDKKIRENEERVSLLNYMDAYRRDFVYSRDLWHEVTAPAHKARRCSIAKGDVFFTPSSEVRDDIGHSAVAMEDMPGCCYSYHVVRLRLHKPWDLNFRAYAFKTKAFMDQASVLCDGSGTRYVISQAKFRSMEVTVPRDKAEQTAIAAILSNMDAEIAALEAKLAKARQVKQGMMQELLTGRVRLVNGEGKMENGECREEKGECREEKGECGEEKGECGEGEGELG